MADLISGALAAIGASKAADEIKTGLNKLQPSYDKQYAATTQQGLNNTYGFGAQRNQMNQGYMEAQNQLNPYARAGIQANNEYMQTLMNPGQYQMSPAAQFQMQQGMGALNNSAMARGGMTGNTLAAMNQYGQGVASQDYNQRLMQLMQASQMGQGASNQLANYGYNNAQNMAGNLGQELGFNQNNDTRNFGQNQDLIMQYANNESARQNGIWGSIAQGVGGTISTMASMFGPKI